MRRFPDIVALLFVTPLILIAFALVALGLGLDGYGCLSTLFVPIGVFLALMNAIFAIRRLARPGPALQTLGLESGRVSNQGVKK